MMKYMRGGSLADILVENQKKGIPIAQAKSITRKILRSL